MSYRRFGKRSFGQAGQAPKLAIIVPCFNEEHVLAETAQRLQKMLEALIMSSALHQGSFILFVDDGSADSTWSIISELNQRNTMVKGLKLSRNFGHQNALLAGLMSVRGKVDCALSIDADLQQDESVIPTFVEKFMQGYDLVLGVRSDRHNDSAFKRRTAELFYGLMRLMGVPIVKNHADYRLVSANVLNALSQYEESNVFLRGLFVNMGFETAHVLFVVKKRYAGESKYSLRKMISFAFNGITAFSVVPLRLITALGFLIFILSSLMSCYVLFIVVFDSTAVPGWASTLLPIYLLGSINMLCLGIVGEYVGRIYREVKRRPRYINEIELL